MPQHEPEQSPQSRDDGGTAVQVDLVRRSDRWTAADVSETALRKAANATYDAAGPKTASQVVLVLCDDAEMRTLNHKWAGKDKATNVLSFPADEVHADGSGEALLGDIVLAFETLEREARGSGIPVEHHACHLVVHGMLHLLGYDHANEEDAVKMEGLETDILRILGLHDPYGELVEHTALQ